MAAPLKIAPLDASVAPYVSVAPSVEAYTVTVTNISRLPLRGLSVEFAGHTHYIRLNTDPLQPMMAPGESWTYSASQALDWAARPNPPPGITLSTILAQLDRNPITVSILWVVDANGRMIGPDPHNDFARLTAQRQARQQLAAELSGAADPKTVLEAALTTQPGPHSGLFDRDFYNEQRKRDARMLSARTNAGSTTAIPNYISRAQREMPLMK